MTRPARCAPGDAEPAGGDADRRRRLDDVLIELGRRLDAGETIDEAAVFRTHAELMPELEENLRALRRLAELARAVGAAEAVGTAAAAPPPAPPPNPLEAALDEELHVLQQALGEYEVLERVRHGGQGVVYKARQRGTNRVVALKLLLDGPLATVEQRARFGREIELVARLRHPNIVAVHGAGVVRGRNFYAMEFIEGLPINDYVVLHDLAPAEIVALMVKVADAVHHAHQNGIIHRDLNPANILVDEAGEPRVFDFGLAKDLWADGQATLTGIGCGTLPYLSPEQAGAGDGRADVRSDVYAIGLVLYELLTDMFPYTVHGEPEAVRAAIINAEPLPLRKAIAAGGPERARGLQNINADLEHVLSRALAKAKDERYQTAAALADELRRWLAGEAVEARAASNWYLLRKTVRRHRVAVSIVGVVMLALAATTGTVLYSSVQIRAERDNAARLSGILVNELEDSFRRLPGGVEARNRLLGKLIERYPEVERLA
ncbi:MAG: serine/threonine-protein kinase, partial [Planctomycetota bacterium]